MKIVHKKCPKWYKKDALRVQAKGLIGTVYSPEELQGSRAPAEPLQAKIFCFTFASKVRETDKTKANSV